MATNHSKVIFGLPTGGGFYGPLTYDKQVKYPTISLQPGATGKEVKKLQDYLVSQGYMTQEQVATGPGIYGPKTKAAVAALQSKLGVDTAGYPGYWGPKTLAKLAEGITPTLAPTTSPYNIGEVGTWWDPTTRSGYSGPKKKQSDIKADPNTGQPIPGYPVTPVAPTTPVTPVTPVAPTMPTVDWSDLEKKYFATADPSWTWMWIKSGTGEIQWYRKENGQWIQKGSESEAKAPFVPPGEEEKEEKKEEKKEEVTPVDKQAIINWLKEQPEYQNLPQDMKDDIIAYIDILGIQDIETQERLLKALDLAKSQADPYFAEIIKMARDTITRGVDVATADFAAREREIREEIKRLEQDLGRALTSAEADDIAKRRDLEIKRTQLQEDLGRAVSLEEADFLSKQKDIETAISRIQQDLTVGKERLSVDEQAELARLGRRYEVELENLREGAAQAGLTFQVKELWLKQDYTPSKRT